MATKRIPIPEKITTLNGKPYRIPVLNEAGDFERDSNGVLQSAPSTSLVDILQSFVIHGIPREKFSRLDSVRVGNVYHALESATGGILELEDADYDWLLKELDSDDIGVKTFLTNHCIIMKAVRNLAPPEPAAAKPKE